MLFYLIMAAVASKPYGNDKDLCDGVCVDTVNEKKLYTNREMRNDLLQLGTKKLVALRIKFHCIQLDFKMLQLLTKVFGYLRF